MPTKTWYPISDSSKGASITPSAGTDHFAMIDEVVADDAATTLQFTPGVGQTESVCGHTDDPVPAGATNISLVLKWKAAAGGSVEGGATTSRAGVKSGSSSGYTTAVNDYVSEALAWTDHTGAAITLDPATGAAWTVAGINAALLIIGANGGSGAPGNYHLQYATQLYAEVSYDLPPTGDWTYEVGRKYLAADASGITAPEGDSITGYSWDWGDLESAGSGVTASHTYAAGGIYTVVLTLSFTVGDDYPISKEVTVPDPTITRVSPLRATLGAAGTACTLTVTNAGATQDTSTLTVGGQAVIVDTWSATSIAFHLDDSPATPYGGQDIVLTVGGVAVTLRNGIYVYNATDNDDTDNILERYLSNVWIDGLHVGLTGQDGLKWTQRVVDKRFISDDTDSPAIIKRKIVGYDIELTLAQLFKNGTLLAAILGGTWDATGKTLTILGQAQQSEHSIMVVDSNGIIEYWSRCYVSGDLTMSINKDWGLAPIKFEALGTDVQVLHKIDESALSWS